MKLENYITLVSTKEVCSNIYVSTDNMLANFGGVIFNDLCPNIKGTKFKENDILLSNIRPYFKKLWYSNCNGVCSSDIVCIRVVNNDLSTKYLYYFLSSNRFFDRYVKGSIGSKMPRGNKNILLEFPITLPTMTKQLHIVDIIGSVDDKIYLNNVIIDKIERQLNKMNMFSKNNHNKKINLKDLVVKNNNKFNFDSVEKTLDLSNISSSSINLSSYSLSNQFKTNLYDIKKGTLFYGSIRPYLKKSGICPFDGSVAGTVHSFNVPIEYMSIVFMTIISDEFHEHANRKAHGTKMPVVSFVDLVNYEINYNDRILTNSTQINNLIQKCVDRMSENYKLKEYKQTILPLLLNEQIK